MLGERVSGETDTLHHLLRVEHTLWHESWEGYSERGVKNRDIMSLKSVPLLVNLMEIKGVCKLVDEGNYKSVSFLVNLENAREITQCQLYTTSLHTFVGVYTYYTVYTWMQCSCIVPLASSRPWLVSWRHIDSIAPSSSCWTYSNWSLSLSSA